MRIATRHDAKQLQDLFAESTQYASQVGHIDRPNRFEEDYFAPYIENKEMYCFEANNSLAGAVRLFEKNSPTAAWPSVDVRYLYVGKLATGDIVRGSDFFLHAMLPSIRSEAIERGKMGLRLECLADNPKLMDFYSVRGFDKVGTARIFSKFYGKHIELIKFEQGLWL